MTQQPIPGSEVVLFEGAPLETVTSDELVKHTPKLLLPGKTQVYLASDVMISNYGVVGCLLVDAKPEQRLTSYGYNDEHWHPAHPDSQEALEAEAKKYHLTPEGLLSSEGIDLEDPEQYARFIGTATGFKLVRNLIMPRQLASQIKQLGSFMGPAFIEESFAGDNARLVPNEEKMTYWPGYDEHSTEKDNERFGPLFYAQLASIERSLGMAATSHNHYVSFHGWPWYNKILNLGKASLSASLTNIDKIISFVDRDKTIPTRDLEERLPQDRDLPD